MTTSQRIETLKEKLKEAKQAEAVALQKKGEFNDFLAETLRANSIPENFNLVDVIEAFAPKVLDRP